MKIGCPKQNPTSIGYSRRCKYAINQIKKTATNTKQFLTIHK